MKHFGIESPKAFGNTAPQLRTLQKQIGKNHKLALSLWKTKFYEARILAALIADPKLVTEEMMESWAAEIDSWAVCDTCCGELFCYTPFALQKVFEWSKRKEEYVKRAGFVLMAAFVIHRKEFKDDIFRSFFPLIVREANDERNFVRKGVNWALRQIGKKNASLHTSALRVAKKLSASKNATARWIGRDAVKDLHSAPVLRRIERAKNK
jgi:3-methyladenine DNA glycosylase AlkD